MIPFHRVTKRRGRIHVGPALPKPDTGGTYVQAARTGEVLVWRQWRPLKAMRLTPPVNLAELEQQIY